MLIAAPTAAARPTRKVTRTSPVANAVAKSGARVETDPSINATRLGCTTFNTKSLLCPETVISRPPSPSRSINAAKTYAPCKALHTSIGELYPKFIEIRTINDTSYGELLAGERCL